MIQGGVRKRNAIRLSTGLWVGPPIAVDAKEPARGTWAEAGRHGAEGEGTWGGDEGAGGDCVGLEAWEMNRQTLPTWSGNPNKREIDLVSQARDVLHAV